jgi:hypothetical protein
VAAGVWFEEGLLCTAPAVDTVLHRLHCAEGVACLLCVTMCVAHMSEEPGDTVVWCGIVNAGTTPAVAS